MTQKLPAIRNRGAVDEAPIEGVIVDGPPPPVAVVRAAARPVTRNAAYVITGTAVTAKRLWESRTAARYERGMRAAEQAGNPELVLAWEDRRDRFLANRHQRRMDMLELPLKAAVALPKILGGLLAVFLVIGVALAISTRDISEVAAPVIITARICTWAAFVLVAFWVPILLGLAWVALTLLWAVGRAAYGSASAPRWTATAADPDMDVSIDETTIGRALDALRIPQISGYLKEGVPLQYLVPCRRDGRGTHAVIRLPSGVTAERIGRRRADLATGLYRLAKEVWPTTGDEEGVLDLWIADKGALAEGAGPYPLLDGGHADA